MGYHIKDIPRGEYGHFDKIKEEFLELEDAFEQNNKIMMLCEMADLIGAIEGFLQSHIEDVSLSDVLVMKNVTTRAFVDGTRTTRQSVLTSPTDSAQDDGNFDQYMELCAALNDLRDVESATAINDVKLFLVKTLPNFRYLPEICVTDGRVRLFWNDVPSEYADIVFDGDGNFQLITEDKKKPVLIHYESYPIDMPQLISWLKEYMKPWM